VLAVYCPDLPPEPGGVADHTVVLARSLASRGADVCVIARRGEASALVPLAVRFIPGATALPAACRDARAESLVVQYVPHLHGRRGIAPQLAPALAAVAGTGVRVVVVVHELFLPPRNPWHALLSWRQRRQLGAILASAHAALTPVPAWLERIRSAGPRELMVRVAPIGATIPPTAASRAEARAVLGLADDAVAIGIISPAAGGFLHEWVGRAVAATADLAHVRWIACGYGSDRLELAGVQATGPLSGPDLARCVRALDLVAAPYFDGLTMRRSGAMLALASGVATVSSTGHLFDFRLAEYAACEPDAEGFAARLSQLARNAEARGLLSRKAAEAGAITSPTALADAILDVLSTPRPAA
jgi:glycosyltransferase involved in cell wall biosynthesis